MTNYVTNVHNILSDLPDPTKNDMILFQWFVTPSLSKNNISRGRVVTLITFKKINFYGGSISRTIQVTVLIQPWPGSAGVDLSGFFG
jgi:hypothetical protein